MAWAPHAAGGRSSAALLSGITGASLGTASAYITDVTTPEKRAGAFGMLGAAFGLGFILGPAIGGSLGELHLRLPFQIAAAFSLLNAAYGFFVLPESLPKVMRSGLPVAAQEGQSDRGAGPAPPAPGAGLPGRRRLPVEPGPGRPADHGRPLRHAPLSAGTPFARSA